MALSEAARKIRNEKLRKWRAEHPEKVKLYAERYWERKAEQALDEIAAAVKEGLSDEKTGH